MQGAKEKVSDMASSVKETVKKHGAKAEEKAEKVTARTEEEKEMVHEKAKAKEAQAEMEKHQEKAGHREESAVHGATTRVPLFGTDDRHRHRPVGGAGAHAGEKYL